MPGTPYPKLPMHRFAWTKLSSQQIQAQLTPAAHRGPASASPLSDAFAGTLRLAADDGLTLALKFGAAGRVSVAEGGGKAVETGYGALVQGDIALIAWLVPGTQRGFAAVIDQASGLATVFELWFSGYTDAREVQRAIHYGYVDRPGQAPPKARHASSNRVEGKGFWWKQDAGAETLEFYPSAGYSNFVELTRQGGELGYCAPSDYIRIDDETFIYTRVECEFSGTLTLYVMDLNRVEQVGLRLGFDPADRLEFYLFRGQGEWLGQIAQFEKFGDTRGDVIPPPPGAPKGARRVYRPLQTMPKMTPAEVNAVAARSTKVFAGASPMAGNATPTSAWLAGKSFTLRYDDGPVMDYRVRDAGELEWRKDGKGGFTRARYQATESAPGVFILGHLLDGEPNHDGHCIVADFHQGLATCFHGFLNTPYFANEAGAETLFGVIEMEGLTPPRYRRHERTNELLGRALTWNYGPGLTSMHLYSTPHSMSWIIFTDTDAGGMEWSGPADYVKIRDGLYFMYWLEEACNGTLGTILINMKTMHDAGVGYHCGAEGLSMSAVGAHGRHAGRFGISRFYQVKA